MLLLICSQTAMALPLPSSAIWGDLATSLAGIDLRVEGEEHLWSNRPAVFIFNHQSALDAILMLKLVRRDLTGVGRIELRRHPVFGPLFAAAGVVFIDRADSAMFVATNPVVSHSPAAPQPVLGVKRLAQTL